jgi:hypothetical protein
MKAFKDSKSGPAAAEARIILAADTAAPTPELAAKLTSANAPTAHRRGAPAQH